MNDNEKEYISGAQLFAQLLDNPTHEQKLEFAIIALMERLDSLHWEHKQQSLADNLYSKDVFCSCADAYRLGHEALKK